MEWEEEGSVDVSVLMFKTLSAVEREEDELVFVTDSGERYRMYHRQRCCESVTIEDIVGELTDLVGSPILMAEEVSNSTDPPLNRWNPDSYTWTFYKFATVKGYVTIRWYGESNGYYSESVDFAKVEG